MKKNFGITLISAAMLIILTGCAADDFFDIRSSMAPPNVSQEQSVIENSIKNYLGGDFKFSRLMVDNKYSSALKCSVGGLEYMVVFCETEDNLIKSHCIFFEKKSENWMIKDDIVEGSFKVREAYVSDLNKDGFDEIVIEGLDVNNSNPKVYVYQIQKDGISPVKI